MKAADAVVRLVEAAEPRCGDCLVVGIDGPSGSGKTTLAAAVAQRLGCPVLHMDDLFPGWDGLAAASGLLVEQVLAPLATGADAGYRRWDWDASRWAERVAVPWTPLLVVEGCASTVGAAGNAPRSGSGSRRTSASEWRAGSNATARRTGRTGSAGQPRSWSCSAPTAPEPGPT